MAVMAPPSVKVSYFNARGLAEVSRLLLKYGGIDFEDVRYDLEKWPQTKHEVDTPFGLLPIYEEHGRVSNQSLAIGRYLAKKVHLIGDTDWENLEIDAIVDTVNDLRAKFAEMAFELNPERKEALKKVLLAETAPFYLDRLEEIAKKNNEHLALGRLTWADFHFASIADTLTAMGGVEVTDNRPSLKAVKDNIYDIPALRDWAEIRPKSNY